MDYSFETDVGRAHQRAVEKDGSRALIGVSSRSGSLMTRWSLLRRFP